jgi:hypothetical protein
VKIGEKENKRLKKIKRTISEEEVEGFFRWTNR